MARYICKRLAYLLITLFIIVSITFFLMKKLPGTPFDDEKLAWLSPQMKAFVMKQYGLGDSVGVQYLKYLGNLVRGDLGSSFYYVGQDVSDIIRKRMGPSSLIGVQSILLGLAFGLSLGIVAAWRHNSGIDYFTMILAVLGVSVPNFVVAAFLQYYVALKLGLLPVAFWNGWLDSILPSIALSFGCTALMARFIRAEMLDVLDQDYIVTARAKGISQFQLLMRHAVRNSIIPVLTILGPIIVDLMTGSLAVESIYAVPGIGSLFVDAIKANDYTTIMGIVVFYSSFYIVAVMVIDILYSIVDPRIRLGSREE